MNISTIKCVVVGNSNVGKTSLLDKMLHDRITSSSSTIGVECRAVIVPGMQNIKVRFWDTAGCERFNAVSRVYYRGVDCSIVCYSEPDEESFAQIQCWVEAIRNEHRGVSKKHRKQIQQSLCCEGRKYVELPHDDGDDDDDDEYGIPIILVVTKCDTGRSVQTFERASKLARELHIQGPLFTSAIQMTRCELETTFKPFFRAVHKQVVSSGEESNNTPAVELSKNPSPRPWYQCC